MTIVRDLKINLETNDLVVESGDLQKVADGPAIAQDVHQALGFVQGEWFRDTSKGFPYFTQVFVKNPRPSTLRTLYREHILARPGVKDILSLVLAFEARTREMAVDFQLDTDLSELPVAGVTRVKT